MHRTLARRQLTQHILPLADDLAAGPLHEPTLHAVAALFQAWQRNRHIGLCGLDPLLVTQDYILV